MGVRQRSRWLHPLTDRIPALEQEAARVSEWLHVMTGLVQPEPDPH